MIWLFSTTLDCCSQRDSSQRAHEMRMGGYNNVQFLFPECMVGSISPHLIHEQDFGSISWSIYYQISSKKKTFVHNRAVFEKD